MEMSRNHSIFVYYGESKVNYEEPFEKRWKLVEKRDDPMSISSAAYY